MLEGNVCHSDGVSGPELLSDINWTSGLDSGAESQSDAPGPKPFAALRTPHSGKDEKRGAGVSKPGLASSHSVHPSGPGEERLGPGKPE